MAKLGTDTENQQIVQAVDRALRILQVLASNEKLMSLSKIARATSMPPSTVHRMLATMRTRGFVRHDEDERSYGVGLAVLPLAEAAKAQATISREAQPILERLAAEIDETASLVLLDGNSGTYSLIARSDRSIGLSVSMGQFVPLHCTAGGKAILAHLPIESRERFINVPLKAYTLNTITNHIRLSEELAEIRARGYAVDNEEREVGMRCIAAPVFNYNGDVIGAVGVSGTSNQISVDRDLKLAGPIRTAAHEISCALGFSKGAH